MKTALIFDLDGTLWDATDVMYVAWRQVFGEYNETKNFDLTMPLLKAQLGKTMDEIGADLFPELPKSLQVEIIKNCGDREDEILAKTGGKLYPKLEETLQQLCKDFDLYIVSNGQDGYIQIFLDAHKLWPYFKDIEMFGRTYLSKGENIKLLMSRNGIQKAIYVGDTAMDQAAAKFAGIPFIHCAYGFGRAEAPDGVLQSFEDLPKLAKAIQ